MALGGFLQGIGLAYGNSLIEGAKLDTQQASADYDRARAQQAQMQVAQQQQQMKTEKDLGQFLSSQAKLDGADATNPLTQAKRYQQAAGIAAQHGDFTSSAQMSKLADESNQEGQKQAALVQQQQAAKKEDLANTADNYQSNPTPEGANDLTRKAIAAGVNPTSIPLTNSPGFASWANDQRLAGMDSKGKATFVQKAYDLKQKREDQQQNHQDNVALRQASMQQTAMYREGMLDLRRSEMASRQDKDPKVVSIGSAQYEYDPSSSLKGDRLASDPRYVKLANKTSAQQEYSTVAIGGAAAEGVRNLDQMSRFGSGTVNSPFVHLSDKGGIEAIAKAGTNAMTPEQTQMFGSSGAGLALEIGRVSTLGGGRGVNQAQINELHTQIVPTAGDSPLTAAYKLSTGAQILKTRMESTPPPADASAAKKWNDTLSRLETYPTPETILNAAQGKERNNLNALQGSYADLQAKLNSGANDSDGGSGVGLPGSPDTGAGKNAPPLPAGWTVKVH